MPLSIVLGLFAATLLNQRLPGWQVFRGIYFLPVVVPMVVLAIVWRWMLGTNTGIANYALSLVGIPCRALADQPALGHARHRPDEGLGRHRVLRGHLPGRPARHPGELARRGPRGRRHRPPDLLAHHRTMLNPVLVFTIVMGTLWAMQIFAEPLLMTEGGPAGASTSTLLYLYRQGFDFSQLGFASAGGIVIAVLILLLVGVERKLLTRDF